MLLRNIPSDNRHVTRLIDAHCYLGVTQCFLNQDSVLAHRPKRTNRSHRKAEISGFIEYRDKLRCWVTPLRRRHFLIRETVHVADGNVSRAAQLSQSTEQPRSSPSEQKRWTGDDLSDRQAVCEFTNCLKNSEANSVHV